MCHCEGVDVSERDGLQALASPGPEVAHPPHHQPRPRTTQDRPVGPEPLQCPVTISFSTRPFSKALSNRRQQNIEVTLHTDLTPTRKSYRDSCWQFGYQALTGLGWLKNHVKVMGEREILNKSYKFS